MSTITPHVIRQILAARHIAVLSTDRDLRILTAAGDSVVLGYLTGLPAHVPDPAEARSLIKMDLMVVLPELAGYEEQIQEILAGQGTILRLPWINRSKDEGDLAQLPIAERIAEGVIRYLDLVVLPLYAESNEDPVEDPVVDLVEDPELTGPNPTDQPIVGLICVLEDSTATGQQHQQSVQQRNELHLLKERIEQESQALAIVNAELAHANKTKSRFVSIAAHELRTPLAAITGYVDLLLDDLFGPLNAEQIDFLHIILSSARRLLDITNNLLDVTMIESGHIELVLNPFDFSHLVERVVTELRPIFQAKEQTIVTQISPDVGMGLIDDVRSIQILSNLLSNASKYSPQGSQITVELALAEDPGYACLAVRDQGVGIPADEQKRLFSRFFRASTAQSVNASGAGLGLHITAHLVELHGGRIWLDSNPEQGSTFYVTLPLWGEKG